MNIEKIFENKEKKQISSCYKNRKGVNMSRKHLGMKRPVKQFVKAVDEMFEYINAFEFLPPRGDGAKEQAIKEWKQVCNNVLIQFNNIRNTQIELLEKGDK